MHTKFFATAAAIALGLAMSAPAGATITGVSTLAGLGATDSIDWSQLGGEFTTVNSGATVTSALGQTATLTSGGSMLRINEGSGWGGNFANGEHLLWTAGNGPDITLTFDHAVSAVGAQFQADFYGPFTAELIGSNGDVLGSFALGGNSDGNNDNSAVFLGLKSSSADIKQVEFHLTSAYYQPNDFALGTVSFAGGAVPEPTTWALMLAGFGLAGAVLRRRRELGAFA